MKILEIGSLNVKEGGPPFSISRQMYGLNSNGVDCCCLMAPCNDEDIIDKNLEYFFTKPIFSRTLGLRYIPKIEETLRDISGINLIHIQGVWVYLSHAASVFARKYKIPYVVSPRGALYHEAIHDTKWYRKWLAWKVYQKEDIIKANCIQATCKEELEELRALGCTNPIAIIPNSYDTENVAVESGFSPSDSFCIGYLGRLHRRKHVEKLIYALSELRGSGCNARLKIIGKDDINYENFLKSEVAKYDLQEYVEFAGFLRGQFLDSAIRGCNIFAFPSNFENWGNVVPDVLVRGIPAIASKGMPWKILEEEECGWWIDASQDSVTNAIKKAYNMDQRKLRLMGVRGRHLIEERYSINSVGKKLKDLYKWILTGESMPDYVYI